MNHRQLSSRPDTPAYEVPSLLGAITESLLRDSQKQTRGGPFSCRLRWA